MAKITLNSIPTSVFKVNASDSTNSSKTRADIVGAGRLLMFEHARKGKEAISKAMNSVDDVVDAKLNSTQYKELNERFQSDMFLYCANKAGEQVGRETIESFEDFKKKSRGYYKNSAFLNVLSGIIEEIVNPILPAVYSTAVDVFANVHEVGFGETYTVSIDSDYIPVFQDSAWGAARSVPRNRFYAKDYTLNPTPRTAQINAKWLQLVGNNMDFGKFFANLAAGMYAKTLGLWNAAMTAAASDTTLVPSALTYAFSDINWITAANKIAALNNTSVTNVIAYGSAVALAKVLPTQATGSSSVNMDAAIMTLLGADYVRAGYIGDFFGVRMMPLQDAIVPNSLTTILDNQKIWLMAGNGRKPLDIAYDSATPIDIEINPLESSDFEIAINETIALDSCATFASKVGLVTI